MSELIKENDNRATIRWKLLTGVSVLALAACLSPIVRAEDGAQPQIWIELGGQLSRLDDAQEAFSPALMSARPPIFSPSQKFERPSLYAVDEDGKISFQPDGSDWIFSASVRYGRSASKRNARQQTNPPPFVINYTSNGYSRQFTLFASANKFANTNAKNSEKHLILDFQAGKDVGLGMFGGRSGSSVLGLGVRFAQFDAKSNITLNSDPDWHPKYFGTIPLGGIYHSNVAAMQATHSFRGVGPSISWSASAPIAGNQQNSELTLDWGVNAAILFGKQRAKTRHQTTGQYHHKYGSSNFRHVTYQTSANHIRNRSVTVPNIGGFAGLSFRYSDAKVSLGYRADFFFNAIDGGIDARKSEDRGFYGPFASISIGMGN